MMPRPRFWIALSASLAAAIIGVVISLRLGDWTSFARSGAIIVIIGALVAAWDSLKEGRSIVAAVKHALSRDRMPSETEGLVLIMLGTLIWAFGDLVGLALG